MDDTRKLLRELLELCIDRRYDIPGNLRAGIDACLATPTEQPSVVEAVIEACAKELERPWNVPPSLDEQYCDGWSAAQVSYAITIRALDRTRFGGEGK